MYWRGLSIRNYISWLQRYIIVHSYIYYELNDNILSDREYDAKAKELVSLKDLYPDEWRKSEYYAQFGDDYNGSTGFTFYNDLNTHQKEIILSIINAIYRNRKGE